MFSLFLFYTRESVENEQILFSNYKEKKKQNRQEENDQGWLRK